jgi:hypothetical protein
MGADHRLAAGCSLGTVVRSALDPPQYLAAHSVWSCEMTMCMLRACRRLGHATPDTSARASTSAVDTGLPKNGHCNSIVCCTILQLCAEGRAASYISTPASDGRPAVSHMQKQAAAGSLLKTLPPT